MWLVQLLDLTVFTDLVAACLNVALWEYGFIPFINTSHVVTLPATQSVSSYIDWTAPATFSSFVGLVFVCRGSLVVLHCRIRRLWVILTVTSLLGKVILYE